MYAVDGMLRVSVPPVILKPILTASEPPVVPAVTVLVPVVLVEFNTTSLPRLRVSPVPIVVPQTILLLAVIVQIPEPIVRVRVFELLEEKYPIVTFLPLASNVPLVRIIARVDPVVRSSASCHIPPTPSNVIGLSRAIPLEVIVDVLVVELKVMVPVYVRVMPAPRVREPDTLIAVEPARVPVKPVRSILPQPVLPEAIVTVPVDEALK